jgi:hypothetical protein
MLEMKDWKKWSIEYSNERLLILSEYLAPKYKEIGHKLYLGRDRCDFPTSKDIEQIYEDLLKTVNETSSTAGLIVYKNSGKYFIGINFTKLSNAIDYEEYLNLFKEKPKRMLRAIWRG